MFRSLKTHIVIALAVLALAGATYAALQPTPSEAQGVGDQIYGYAWSDTIGWISLNCANHGTCGTSTYYVAIDSDGDLSGYAWSENVGWISANSSDLAGCPQSPCDARVVDGELVGWLKVLSSSDSQSGGWDGWIALTDPGAGSGGSQVSSYLTTGTNWTVPGDWNSSNNTVEVIGGGGGGGIDTYGFFAEGGGGGGAYAKTTNLSLTGGAVVTYAIGGGGGQGVAGGDTYFCDSSSNCGSISGTSVKAGAKGGGGGIFHTSSNGTGGAGGATSASVGQVKYTGGSGASGGPGANGGGGGAAGRNGAGNNGSGGTGGTGDAGQGGSGGSGGAAGSNGQEWSTSYGSGGGGGGGAVMTGGRGGNYGAGGGGGSGGSGGPGAQGLIVITYTPQSSPAFGITLDEGEFSGYAWGDTNIGWIDFSFATTTYGTDRCDNLAGYQASVPTGYIQSGTSCVNYCTPQSYCDGDDLYRNNIENNMCVAALYETCSLGCVNGACLGYPPPAGGLIGGSEAIVVRPSIVPSGRTVRVVWEALNVDEDTCSVVGSNGDRWDDDASSGNSGVVSSPITARTTYALTCTGLDGTTLTDTATVNLVPVFNER